MKRILHTNRLDESNYKISSSSFNFNNILTSTDFNSIHDEIVCNTENIFSHETELLAKYSKNYKLRNKNVIKSDIFYGSKNKIRSYLDKKDTGPSLNSDPGKVINIRSTNIIGKFDIKKNNLLESKSKNLSKNLSKDKAPNILLTPINKEGQFNSTSKAKNWNNKKLNSFYNKNVEKKIDDKFNKIISEKFTKNSQAIKTLENSQKNKYMNCDHKLSKINNKNPIKNFQRPPSQSVEDLITAPNSGKDSKRVYFTGGMTTTTSIGFSNSIPGTNINTIETENEKNLLIKSFTSNSSETFNKKSNRDLVKVVNFKEEKKNNKFYKFKINKNMKEILEEGSPPSKFGHKRDKSNKFEKSDKNENYDKCLSLPQSTNENYFEASDKGNFLKLDGNNKKRSILENVLSRASIKQQKEFLETPKIKFLLNSKNKNLEKPKQFTKCSTPRTKTPPIKLDMNDPKIFFENRPKSLFIMSHIHLEPPKPIENVNEQISKKIYTKDKPKYRTSVALNSFLIRDFTIGQGIDALKSSKKKLELTEQMYQYLNKEKEKKINKQLEIYEKEKFGGLISNINEEKSIDIEDFQSNLDYKLVNEYKMLKEKENVIKFFNT